MVLSGLPVPSFFNQIATAILFKKKDRPAPKIPHEIYNDKNQNNFQEAVKTASKKRDCFIKCSVFVIFADDLSKWPMEHIDLTWFVVVNPHAGSGKTLSRWQLAETLMRKKGISYSYNRTDGKMHAAAMACEAARMGYRRFVAVGGDGTVHEILEGIMRYLSDNCPDGGPAALSDFYLAVIPIGSGNDWIKSHNVPYDTEKVVDMLASGSFSVQDIVKVSAAGRGDMPDGGSCSYMINVGGIGLDARICARVNRQKDAGRSGRLLYLNSLIYNLVKSRPFRACVECDGDVIYDGRCLSIAFGLGKYSGGGFRQTPYAVMDDGLLDVTVIPVLPLHVIMTQAYRLLDGTFPGIKGIVSCKASSVSVTSLDNDGEIIEVDGEIVGTLPARLEILPGRLHVLHRTES